MGEKVSTISNVLEGFETITIPGQTYVKFTTNPGDMPDVIRNTQFEIWGMDEKALGGKRSYGADSGVYDERSIKPDHRTIVIDVFIGLD